MPQHILPLCETPIIPSEITDFASRIWYKRDDLLPFSFGGNKVRIADAYLRDALAEGATSIVAYGNARSNLCRVLANACCRLSLPCTIISPADEDGTRQKTANAMMVDAFGAEIVPCKKTGVKPVVERVLEEHIACGLKPYYIYGNTNGTGKKEIPVAAYDDAFEEIWQWQQGAGIHFDAIVLALGTGMTAAGLAAGLVRKDVENTRIIGISTARAHDAAQGWVSAYFEAYTSRTLPENIVDIHDEWVGAGYGCYDQAMLDDALLAASVDGLGFDMTYTGKAFHGMLEMLRTGERLGENVLFLHSGGTPLFFDKVNEIMGEAHHG